MSAPHRLLIPDTAWQMTAAILAPYTAARVEAGLYWFGVRTAAAAVVAHVGVPAQINRSRNFQVDADALAALIRAVPEDLVVVAALHTHPGSDTHHSEFDDARAVSRKVLSLVLPHYGAHATLRDAGVHECAGDRWSQLTAAESRQRVLLISTLSDTRR